MIIKTIKIRKIYFTSTILLIILILCSLSIYAFSNESIPFIWKSEEEKKYIKWVDFTPTYEALSQTAKLDIDSHNDPNSNIKYNWIELLSYLACKYGGDFKKYDNKDLINLTEKLQSGITMVELTKDMKNYAYYYEAYDAVLHEYIGEYQVEVTNSNNTTNSNITVDSNVSENLNTSNNSSTQYQTKYGIKAFLPIAKNYNFSHYDDFGNSRSYGYKRVHLGNDLMGSIRNSYNCC